MVLTKAATEAILDVMMSYGLDPAKFFLEIKEQNGGIGMGFTPHRGGRPLKFGDLTVLVAYNIDTSGVTVDYREMNGRKGLIFLGENNG